MVDIIRLTPIQSLIRALLLVSTMSFAAGASALVELDDDGLEAIDGAGIAFAWTDFRWLTAPTSYTEQVGAAPPVNGCTAGGNVAGNHNCWRRGDVRWFGAGVSNTSTSATGAFLWGATGSDMTACGNAGYGGLGCPRGGLVSKYAAHDNPYILRAFDYAGNDTGVNVIGNGIVTYEGHAGSGQWSPTSTASTGVTAGSRQTVLEWLAPTKQDPFRFSFWGEIEVGKISATNRYGLLKSQTIVQGTPSGSKLQFFKFTQTARSPGLHSSNDAYGCYYKQCTLAPNLPFRHATSNNHSSNVAWDGVWHDAFPTNLNPNRSDHTPRETRGAAQVTGDNVSESNQTLGIVYYSVLEGDFRFSVMPATGVTTEDSQNPHKVIDFHPTEGLHFRNVSAAIPLGQLFYQALTINLPKDTSGNRVENGNFTLEIPMLPNREAVYTRFYSQTKYARNAVSPNAWDDGYATARAAMLSSEIQRATGFVTAMPDNYLAPDANYYKTHGYSRWGDWYPCQGIGCVAPNNLSAATRAKRNAWNSTSDGIFFGTKTGFKAFAYRVTAIDVRSRDRRPGSDSYTAVQYYANQGACTATTGVGNTPGAAYGCGYGGSYAAMTGLSNETRTLPQNIFLMQAGNNGANLNSALTSTTGSIPYMNVPANTALNIGDGRVEGLQINYLRFTSKGAQY